MRRTLLPVVLAAFSTVAFPLTSRAAEPETGCTFALVLSQNFDAPFAPTQKRNPNSPSTVKGSLPAGLIEDSAYKGADVAVKNDQVTGVGSTGGALRIAVSRITQARPQLLLPGIKLSQTHDLKVRVNARSSLISTFRIGIRKGSQPYTYYDSQTVAAAIGLLALPTSWRVKDEVGFGDVLETQETAPKGSRSRVSITFAT